MTTSAKTALAEQAERMLRLYLQADPLEATLTGFREYDEQLADLSKAGEAAHAEAIDQVRVATLAIAPDELDENERLTRAVLLTLADHSDDIRAVEGHAFTVAAFPVAASSILLAFVRMVVLTNEEQADAYLARLRAIPRYLEQSVERLADGRARGLVPVGRLTQMAIDQIDMFLQADPNPLALPAPADHPDPAEWTARRDGVIEDVVKPAFQNYRDVLATDVLPSTRSTDEPGLVYLPDGLARYARLVRVHTTTDRTPEELHRIGLDIVAGVHEEFRALGLRMLGTDDLRTIFTTLTTDPAYRWHTAQEILDAAESSVRRAEVVAPLWFGRLPEAVCALEAVPELEAEGAAPAYYMPPAQDGSRPGTYFTNVNRPEDRTSFDLEATAFHEAVPGHHLQISLALETSDLPMIRRLSFFTAYVEGWGLYSERLADEMGLYSSDAQRMGMLSADAWRAARLVVDTGLHAMGWSRQQAVDYLVENTSVALIDVESEIDRYIAMPGQALSYMTGRLEIQALRERAQQHLGEAFDIRDFHDVVLLAGALPLSTLGEVVEDWLAEVRPPVG